GAPQSASAGILFNAPLGKQVSVGDTLFTLYAHTKGELEYALTYLKTDNIITIE
ncbi:thymidine phosphorylase, partial [Acinetobacter baumannii]